ncbi:TrmH family RNA methyltransferase [Armatimonas sp.]|uniref:TrmH family RNA methyltransferase n=1 Tax=Armatimonas sp. TaxID=1872638 RepID=UPI0037534F2A
MPILEPLCIARGIPLYVLAGGLLQKLTGTGYETAVSALAIVKQGLVKPEALLSDKALILCGERLQDPRNVGVLIRTAEALGCTGLVLSAGSAEPFSRQAVRSTTGSVLRLPIALVADLPKVLMALREQGATVVSSSGAAPQTAAQTDLTRRPLVIVMGNEQEGISDAVASASDTVVRLPMAPSTGADSYNVTVAAGMLLYEAIRMIK